MAHHPTSRRALLGVLAGAAVSSGAILRGASLRRRCLVSIRLADAADAGEIYSSGLLGARLHDSLSHVSRQFNRRMAAVVDDDLPGNAELGYLQGGFALPRWMMRSAGADVADSAGRAWTFSTGLVMLTPDGFEYGGMPLQGAVLDNPTLLELTGRKTFSFPATSIGNQLRQTAALLASSSGNHMLFAATLAGPASIAEPRSARAKRLKKLDEAIAAFESAVSLLGIESDVTTVTEAYAASHVSGPARTARLVLGGAVADGTLAGGEAHRASAVLEQWGGYSARQVS
jgi:hypothetical protein